MFETKTLQKSFQSKYNEIKYQHMIPIMQLSSLLDVAKKDLISKIVAGGIVINKDSKVLVVKRAAKEEFLPGILEFPSGNLEKDESLLDGLAREVKEETSYEDILVEKYINCFDYTSRSGKSVRQFNFLVKLNRDEEPILNNEEHQNYYWCNFKEAVAIGCDRSILDCLEIVYSVGFNSIDMIENGISPSSKSDEIINTLPKILDKSSFGVHFSLGFFLGKAILSPAIKYLDNKVTNTDNIYTIYDYFAPKLSDMVTSFLFYGTYRVMPPQISIAGKLAISKSTVDFASGNFELSQDYVGSLFKFIASNFIIFSSASLAGEVIIQHPFAAGAVLSIVPELVDLSTDLMGTVCNEFLGSLDNNYKAEEL